MSNGISRRHLLGTGAAGLGAGLLGIPSAAFGAQRRRDTRRAKNIIFCVSDGMSASAATMVDHLSQIRDGKPSYWSWLMKQEFAVNGLQDTRSLTSLVTDSSAASSSWGSGRHIWNGQVNMFPDGTELRTINSLMKGAGLRTGLVTTATISHATPAGFAVNCVHRDLEALIAERYLKAEVDILMGGGDRFFAPDKRQDKRDLYGDFAKAGYRVVKDRASTLGLRAPKILGIYSPSHLPHTVDRDNDPALRMAVPTLAEMTQAAIDNLKDAPRGFLLQVEGARIDHAAHSNDLAGMLFDQMAFEEAVKVAVDFAVKDGNTLVVVTSDHATGNPGLNGSGDEYIDSTAGLKLALGMKASYWPMLAEIGREPSASRVQEVVRERLGVGLSQPEAEAIVQAIAGKSPFGLSHFYGSPNGTLAMILGNHTKVTWTSGNHTSDHVLVTAIGPGQNAFAGLTQNISMFDILLAQHGLRHSNPTMTFEDARRHLERNKERDKEALAALSEMYGAHEECGCQGVRAH